MIARWVVVLLCAAPGARAQEFVPASPVPLQGSALGLLEHGLAAAPPRAALESTATRWWGLPELDAFAFAVAAGPGTVRAAAGLARFGDAALGWNALGLALASAHAHAGASVRVVARQDRDRLARTGIAAGGGAWVRAGHWAVHASAPQLWLDGAAPPVARGLETGVTAAHGGGSAWFAFAAAPSRDAQADRRAGIVLHTAALSAWAEGVAPPWRLRAGIELARGPLRMAAGFESHPVLGETTRLSLALAGGP